MGEPQRTSSRRRPPLRALAAVFACAAPCVALAQGSQGVTTEDVKRFLDPTVMINSASYDFGANFLPSDRRAYNHRASGFVAINHWTGVWAEVPYTDFSFPDGPAPSGVGDVLMGWGVVTHENLASRFTASALLFEATAPTGDPENNTGVGAWVLSPTWVMAFNPTDVFPVYVDIQYLHSVGPIGPEPAPGQPVGTAREHIRALQLRAQTIHILPKGFYVAAVPSLAINLNRDFNVFSLALGGGRAITRSFAWNASYAQHLAGTQTFNRVASFGIQYLFGSIKDGSAPRP